MTVVLSLILLNLAELSRKLQNLLEVYMYTQYICVCTYCFLPLLCTSKYFPSRFFECQHEISGRNTKGNKVELRHVIPDGNRQM